MTMNRMKMKLKRRKLMHGKRIIFFKTADKSSYVNQQGEWHE